MPPIEWQRQLTDRAVVLLGPREALLHEHQLITRGHALQASPAAPSPSPLSNAVCALRQLALASPADFHDPAGRRFGAVGPVCFPFIAAGDVWSDTTSACRRGGPALSLLLPKSVLAGLWDAGRKAGTSGLPPARSRLPVARLATPVEISGDRSDKGTLIKLFPLIAWEANKRRLNVAHESNSHQRGGDFRIAGVPGLLTKGRVTREAWRGPRLKFES